MSQSHNTQGGKASDRREHKRFVMLEFARLKLGENIEESSVLVDVSLGGIQLRSKKQYEAGATIEVTIGRGDIEPVSVNAVVRYSLPIKKSDLFATGLAIQAEDRDQRVKWVDYVQETFKLQGESLI